MDGLVTGPLAGVRVVELGGIGPAPFCGMILADLGADVTVIARSGRAIHPVLDRGKKVVPADLKNPADCERVRALLADADALIEGWRPGVAERLGFGPRDVAEVNPRIVYGRITGFGRSGPLADRAGHDINYVSMSGVLGAMGPEGTVPTPPLNLVADFGGGGLLLALGVTAALHRVAQTGAGEVVDTSMVDGSAVLMSMIYGFRAVGRWTPERGANMLDGGAPFYRTYACADNRHIAVGAIEPAFFANLVNGLGLGDRIDCERQQDRTYWPELSTLLAETFATRARDAWAETFAGIDACLTPVLGIDEVAQHPHNIERGTFSPIEGGVQPNPAPHFSPLPAPERAPLLEGTVP